MDKVDSLQTRTLAPSTSETWPLTLRVIKGLSQCYAELCRSGRVRQHWNHECLSSNAQRYALHSTAATFVTNKLITLNHHSTQYHWQHTLEWGCSVGSCMLINFHIKFIFLLCQIDAERFATLLHQELHSLFTNIACFSPKQIALLSKMLSWKVASHMKQQVINLNYQHQHYTVFAFTRNS